MSLCSWHSQKLYRMSLTFMINRRVECMHGGPYLPVCWWSCLLTLFDSVHPGMHETWSGWVEAVVPGHGQCQPLSSGGQLQLQHPCLLLHVHQVQGGGRQNVKGLLILPKAPFALFFSEKEPQKLQIARVSSPSYQRKQPCQCLQFVPGFDSLVRVFLYQP